MKIILNMLLIFNAALVMFFSRSALAEADIFFLISNQIGSEYHRQLGENARIDILKQARELSSDYRIYVKLFHEISSHPGNWILLNVLAHLHDNQLTPGLINDNTRWIIVCEESTQIKLKPLLSKLSHENFTEPLLLGHPLYDHEATIIHHFAFFEKTKWFPYPMLSAGIVLSPALLKSLAAVLTGDYTAIGAMPPIHATDFSIDAAYEFARFIWDNVPIKSGAYFENTTYDVPTIDFVVDATKRHHWQHSFGETSAPILLKSSVENKPLQSIRKIILRKSQFICPKADIRAQVDGTVSDIKRRGSEGVPCAMFAKPMDTTMTLCSFAITLEQIFVAIKTCQKYHGERIPIIEATWAPSVVHKRYYSDVSVASIPTISTGVPNSETGHCEKTLAILKLALKDIEQLNGEIESSGTYNSTIRWLLLSDDDTLLSFSRLRDFLSCFNYTDQIYLGERYGYRLYAKDGFNYITGGGGIIFSLPVVKLILIHCTCPATTSPDDMILGSCLQTLGVKAIHSSRFHQARPKDYPHELLQVEQPISFHKFWQQDPLNIYKKWFADIEIIQDKPHKSCFTKNENTHCEHEQDPLDSVVETNGKRNMSFSSFEHESSSNLDL